MAEVRITTSEVTDATTAAAGPAISIITTDGGPGAPGPGVAAGGTTGQVLAKASTADYDTHWVDPATGGTGGGGAVDSVNGHTGAVVLAASDVGADASGAASTALTTAEGYTDTKVAAEVSRADGAYDTLGAAATAQAAAVAASQPLDTDLTAIAALSTTTFGRSLLTQADAAALRTTAGLGSAATQASTAFDASGAAAAAQAASQPLDSDLTAIAALATTSFGRGLLALADAAGLRTTAGLGGAATLNVGTSTGTVAAGDDSRITGAAQKSANLSDLASASTARTNLGLGTAATVNTGTSSGNVPLLSTGGVLPIAQLATGTPDGTKFVRDDGTLATPAGGGASSNMGAVVGMDATAGRYALPGWLIGVGASWAAGAAPSANGIVFIPIVVTDASVTYDRISCNVTTAAAGSVARMGIYDSSGTKKLPGARVIDAGTVDTSTTGVKEAVISWTPSAGLYWLAWVSSSTSVICTALPIGTGLAMAPIAASSTTTSLSYFPIALATSTGAATGGLPATAPSPILNYTLSRGFTVLRMT